LAIPTDDRNRKSAINLDGAHVPFNLAAVLHDLNRIREFAGFCVVVFGTTRDKQAFEMLDLLRRHRVDGSFRIVGEIRSIIRELEARQRPIPAQ
jgi:dihydrofolate synthase/folylpolyglutamate synthase